MAVCDAVVSRTLCSKWARPKELRAHYGCVNALSFSTNGRLMASGSDDTRVLLWTVYDAMEETKPIMVKTGHLSNVFSIVFDSTSRSMFSSGNDGMLLKFDIESNDSNAVDVVKAHSLACLKVTMVSDDVLLTAGQDGAISKWDMRMPVRLVGSILRKNVSINCIDINPVHSNYFVSCNADGQIDLNDMRCCFSSSPTAPPMSYTTKLYRERRVSRGIEITNAVWDPSGSFFGASFQKWLPTIYTMHDEHPLCVLDSNRGYKALATLKSNSFSDHFGQRHTGLHFVAGSDDFTAYGWGVPSLSEMLANRSILYDSCDVSDKTVYISSTGAFIDPMRVSQDFQLPGHRSIVNSALCHPTLPLIATSGVEKCIRLFSPTALDDSTPSKPVQPLERRGIRPSWLASTLLEDTVDEDPAVLAYFDYLIREQELVGDLVYWKSIDCDSSDDSSSCS